MAGFKANSEIIGNFRIFEKFCDQVFQRQKLTQNTKFRILFPTQLSKNCKKKFKSGISTLKIENFDSLMKNFVKWTAYNPNFTLIFPKFTLIFPKFLIFR